MIEDDVGTIRELGRPIGFASARSEVVIAHAPSSRLGKQPKTHDHLNGRTTRKSTTSSLDRPILPRVMCAGRTHGCPGAS